MIIFRFRPFVVLAATALVVGCSKSEAAQEQAYIEAAKDYVRSQLKDPDSAEFRDLAISEKGHVCGQLNAKNSFGGYNGFTPFLVDGQTGELFVYDQNQNWSGKGYDARLFRERVARSGQRKNEH